jgi:hypothetical protein
MKKAPIPISGIFFYWAGFVCSISFMEAWLKFRAPGVTLPEGLGIGKLVFTALNRMEWVFVFILMILLVPHIKKFSSAFISISGTVIGLLMLQTLWLLPQLTHRAELIIAGYQPGESYIHLLFGIAEVLKVLFLLYLGKLAIKKAIPGEYNNIKTP